MHETFCFSMQSPSPNLDDLPLRCDGCETVSCVVGSSSDMLGSCSDRFRIVKLISRAMKTMFSIGFMTYGAEGFLLRSLDGYGTVGTGLGAGTGAGTVQVRYPHPYPHPNSYQPSRTYHLAYRPASKMANRALLSKLANGVSTVLRVCVVDRIPL